MQCIKQTFFTLLILTVSTTCFSQMTIKTDSLIKAIKAEKNDTNKVLLLQQYAKILKVSKTDSAISTYKQALEISERNGFYKGMAVSCSMLGELYYTSNNYLVSLLYYKRGLAYYKVSGDRRNKIRMLNKISSCYRRLENYDEALLSVMAAIEENVNHDYKKELAESYGTLGNIYRSKELYDNALKYYLLNLKESRESKDKNGEAICYNNIGLIKKGQLRYSEALEDFNAAAVIAGENNFKKTLMFALNNSGEVLMLDSKYSEAESNFNAALNIAMESNNDNDLLYTYTNLFKLNMAQKKNEKAQAYADSIMKLADDLNNSEFRLKAYSYYAELYAQKSDFQKAYGYQKKYSDLKDSTYIEQANKKIKEMKLDYNLDIELLKMQSKSNSSQFK